MPGFLPGTDGGPITLAGDTTGPSNANTNVAVQGQTVLAGDAGGQAWVFNGTTWASGNPSYLSNVVTGYGVDNSGATDMGGAFNAALTSLAGTGQIAWLPPGTYKVSTAVVPTTATIIAMSPGVTFTGANASTLSTAALLYAEGELQVHPLSTSTTMVDGGPGSDDWAPLFTILAANAGRVPVQDVRGHATASTRNLFISMRRPSRPFYSQRPSRARSGTWAYRSRSTCRTAMG